MNSTIGHQSCPSCPSSDAFYRWTDGHGYCFSCGYKESGNGVQGIKSRLAPVTDVQGHMPLDDYTYQLPAAPIKWLNKYGITHEEILKHKLMWNQRTESLTFPLFVNDRVVATCERHFGNKNYPKYLTRGKPHRNLPILKGKDSSIIVLTEDFVSAIKVSRICDAMPLLGASLPTSVIIRLHDLSYAKSCIWLDRNKATEAMKFASRMSQVLPGVRLVISQLDPKEYRSAVMKEFIYG